MRICNIFLLGLIGFACIGHSQDTYMAKRKAMVTRQLKARGINNKATLKAMLTVPRHLFVPEQMKSYAYADSALPIGNKQTISQPYIVAFMTQELHLKPNDKVLKSVPDQGIRQRF